ncbi:MAG: ketoacyl-ACP synthase III [Lentisphaerae bacterium]|nr:ketoacyl-ACP synthase III [Lentisphaerota bacterium]
MGIRIAGTGRCIPEKILTNDDLEKMVDTSDEWIVTRTGIKERHIAEADQTTSDLAAEAAKKALENAGITADMLDLIIVSTITPDHIFPCTAALVQRKIGAGKCPCFDTSAACSGLLYAFNVAYGMMSSPLAYKRVLVIGAEKMTSLVDWTDRSTCVLFGDGAAAFILENDGNPETPDFYVAGEVAADGNAADILIVPASGSAHPASLTTVAEKMHYIKMGGPKTFQLAVLSMVSACRNVLEKAGLTPDDVVWAIPHQANRRIIDAVANKLGIPEKVYLNVDRYGNTSSASIGICLDELHRAGKIKRGDLILAASFGAGLTWAAMLIRW